MHSIVMEHALYVYVSVLVCVCVCVCSISLSSWIADLNLAETYSLSSNMIDTAPTRPEAG